MAKMNMDMLWNTGGDPHQLDEAAKQKVEEYITRRVGDFGWRPFNPK